MRIRTAVVSLALVAAGVGAAGAPAQAAESGPTAQAARTKPQHCIVNVTTAQAKVACYDNFTVAISKATGGRINDAPADAGKAADDAIFENKLKALSKFAGQAGIQAQNIIEIDYDYWVFGTDTFTWWVENGGCWDNPLGVVRYSVPDLGAYGWNDRINAFSNDQLCYSRHFEHSWFQGLAIGWDYGRSNLYPLDGEISSIQWS